MKVNSKVIWKIFIDHIKNQHSLPARNVIWDLCNDFIMYYPELEGEEELQKEFVELYDSSKKIS